MLGLRANLFSSNIFAKQSNAWQINPSRNFGGSRVFLQDESKKKEDEKPKYIPRKPVIRVRDKPSVISTMAAKQKAEIFGEVARNYFVKVEDKRIVDTLMQRHKWIVKRRKARLDRKAKFRQLKHARATAIRSLFKQQKQREATARFKKWKAYQELKSEARKEMIKALSETEKYWVRTPAELTYSRYKFDPHFRLKGTKFENWVALGMNPMMSAAKNARKRAS